MKSSLILVCDLCFYSNILNNKLTLLFFNDKFVICNQDIADLQVSLAFQLKHFPRYYILIGSQFPMSTCKSAQRESCWADCYLRVGCL